MKKMTTLCAGLLLLLSSSIFAEKHVTAALLHANPYLTRTINIH
jgi:hypothetical protein